LRNQILILDTRLRRNSRPKPRANRTRCGTVIHSRRKLIGFASTQRQPPGPQRGSCPPPVRATWTIPPLRRRCSMRWPERTQPRVCAALPPVAGTAPATYHGGAPGTGQRKQRLCGDSPGGFLFGEGLRKAVASVAVCLFACAGEPSVQLPDRDAQSGCRRRIDILRRHTETERASYSSGTIAKHFGVITDLSRLLVRMGFLSTAMDPRLSATALGES